MGTGAVGFAHTLLSDDFEFYRDKGGATLSKQAFLKLSRERRCEQKIVLKRELVPGSLTVFPLRKGDQTYGAIQTGSHDFYVHDEAGNWNRVETASFTHLWLHEEDDWRLSRVLSYNHVAVGSE